MLDLFDQKEIICMGNGLIIGGCRIEEKLLQETELLGSQLRGDESKTILYIPRLAEVSFRWFLAHSK